MWLNFLVGRWQLKGELPWSLLSLHERVFANHIFFSTDTIKLDKEVDLEETE